MQRLDLKGYLESKNIFIIEKKINKAREVDKDKILNQVKNIITFQEKVKEYRENLMPRLKGSLGREIDEYSSKIVLLTRYINSLDNKINLNCIENYIKLEGSYILDRCNKSLDNLYKNNYTDLIKRSMLNYEICLTRVDESNLYKEDEKLIIGTIRYLVYNIKEHDIFSYIKKIKRRDLNFNIEDIISFYIDESKLNKDSFEYLKSLSSYPDEQMKIIQRYILNKIDLDESSVLENLYKAKKIDDNGIII